MYRLKLPTRWGIHNVFHVDRLTPAIVNEVYGKVPQPEPEVVEGKLEYEVDEILDSKHDRRYSGGILYLVRWKGYGPGGDTWEGLKNLVHAKEAIAEFHRKHPEAPRKLSAATFLSLPWQPLVNFTEASTSYAWEDGRRGR